MIPRVAVLIHVAGADSLGGVGQHLSGMPVPFDVILTNGTGGLLGIADDLFGPNAHDVRVLEVDGRYGEDLLPLVLVVNAGLLEPYDLVLTVHVTGEGTVLERGLAELVGSTERIGQILGAFAEDPSLGIVVPQGALQGASQDSADGGCAVELARELVRRLELDLDERVLLFSQGRVHWVRSFMLNGLRALEMSEDDFGRGPGESSRVAVQALRRAIGALTAEAGFAQREVAALERPETEDAWLRYSPETALRPEARVFPFYLPQFHRFPENESWWGPGFSEWNNVAAAKPMFVGHRQPNLPSDLGYYDLDDPRVRSWQYALARNAGIEGFMYYHYWFAGRPLMSMPIEALAASEDDHPFCLMWANENWTRRWDGGSENILIAQDHREVPPERFIDDVRHLLSDERYARVDGRPVLAVYRIAQLPDYRSVIAHWRRRAQEFGLPGLHLLSVDVGSHMEGLEDDETEKGLDGVMEFPPHNRRWVGADIGGWDLDPAFKGHVMRYDALVAQAEEEFLAGLESDRYPGVLVNFDNTARRQLEPDLWFGSNPFTFRRWLRLAVLAVQDREPDQRIVFINAWNEWAEGAVLEPSQRFGRSYLQAVRSAVVCP